MDFTGRSIVVTGGTGALGVRLQEALTCDVTVLDPTPEMLRYIPDFKPVHAVVGTAEDMPFENSTFARGVENFAKNRPVAVAVIRMPTKLSIVTIACARVSAGAM